MGPTSGAAAVGHVSQRITGNGLSRVRAGESAVCNVKLLDDFVTRNADLFEWVRPKAGAIAFITPFHAAAGAWLVPYGICACYLFTIFVEDEL